MVTIIDLQAILLDELGYDQSPGFSNFDLEENLRPLPDVSGAYLVRNIPVAYFSHFEEANPERLLKLYQSVWNQSKAPLLYVVTPQTIQVYNSYAEPVQSPEELNKGDRLLHALNDLVSVEDARQKIRHQLASFERLNLDTGAFWTTLDGQRIQREHRADNRLLRAMDQVRQHLLKERLSNEVAYALLGRSIFVRYLEDRGILDPESIKQLSDHRASNYLNALANIATAYRLFERLGKRFNGDLFPVDDKERREVKQKHLNLIESFLRGTDLDTRQTSFWPYNFQYIPIELISGIYDTFLSDEKRRGAGTYYTPLALVDFMLDETLPTEVTRPDMKIFDPACGSGIFLVKAYQRLVNSWHQKYGERPNGQQLGSLLQQNIFGVDIQPEAIRVAAFSLYLAMLDNMEEQEIKDVSFRFPPLKNRNLIAADFFSSEVERQFGEQKFSRVVGNPPWGKLTPPAEKWLQSHDKIVGDKQIAQAFLMRAPDFCEPDGELALLAPAKSTILVTSSTHEKFRQSFFEEDNVRAVVNFSALCYELFADSIHPAVSLFYQPSVLQSHNKRLIYAVPKPSPLSQQLGAIILDATEIKYLDREELHEYPSLWKVALWGSAHDATLIQKLSSLPTLKEQANKLGWKVAEGIQINGGDENPAPWLQGLHFLPTEKFRRYLPDMDAFTRITETVFHRPRSPEIIQGPLALIHESPLEKRCAATLFDGNVAYNHRILGLAGKKEQKILLKWLVAYINSPLSQYWHFLTSSSWAVERGIIIQEEYERMPFLIPDKKDERFIQTINHFDQITATLQKRSLLTDPNREALIRKHEDAIAKLVFDLYGFSPIERQLVYDMVEYGIEFFYWGKLKQRKPKGTNAVKSPDADILKRYAQTFIEIATSLLRYQEHTLNAIVYHNGAPLSVIGFELIPLNKSPEIQVIPDATKLREILKRLDEKLLEQRTPTLYMRRHVRIYDGSQLFLVRPSEQRFWTRSQALLDADEAIAEWLTQTKSIH